MRAGRPEDIMAEIMTTRQTGGLLAPIRGQLPASA